MRMCRQGQLLPDPSTTPDTAGCLAAIWPLVTVMSSFDVAPMKVMTWVCIFETNHDIRVSLSDDLEF